MTLHIYHHFPESGGDPLVRQLLREVRQLRKDLKLMDADLQAKLDTLNSEITDQTTVEQSAVTLITGLKSSLDAALANSNPADVIAAVQTISDHLQANTSDLAAAVAANTAQPAA